MSYDELIMMLFADNEEYARLQQYRNLYIYGAGYVGKLFLRYLESIGMRDKVKGFIVSDTGTHPCVAGMDVRFYGDVEIDSKDAIVVAVTDKHRYEILQITDRMGSAKVIEVTECDEPIEYFRCVDEKDYPEYLRWHFLQRTGKDFNPDNPGSFSEKIQWIKLFENDPIKTRCADKYLARSFAHERVGGKYLVPILGVWKSFDEIEFDKLPERFVLKCTHGSSMNAIVSDKKRMDVESTKREFDKWLRKDYSFCGLERHYHDIQPQIMAEEFLDDKTGELKDYKFWCFNGKIAAIQVDLDRYTNHKRNFYSMNWEILPMKLCYEQELSEEVEKPKYLDEMIDVTERLAEGFNFVRVDLYYVEDKIYFGEMTFTPESGMGIFSPAEYDNIFGSMLDLPVKGKA